jgi:hypothetical protein
MIRDSTIPLSDLPTHDSFGHSPITQIDSVIGRIATPNEPLNREIAGMKLPNQESPNQKMR